MATWKKDKNDVAEIVFEAGDLVFFNIQNTKKTLSEIMSFSSYKIIMDDVRDFDSTGLQLIVQFIAAVRIRGGLVEVGPLPEEVVKLADLLGIADMGMVELINDKSFVAGGSNV